MDNLDRIKTDYISGKIDFETAKVRLHNYNPAEYLTGSINLVLEGWKLERDQPENIKLLDKLCSIESKNNLTTVETATLMTILRMAFDRISINNLDNCETIISISKKLELAQDFIQEMKSDLFIR